MIIIIGILLAIAIPSYLKFRDRANESAAKANVRASIPGLEAYYADNNSYVGMTLAGIQSSYDAGIKNISFGTLTATATACSRRSARPPSTRQAPRRTSSRAPAARRTRQSLTDERARETAPFLFPSRLTRVCR